MPKESLSVYLTAVDGISPVFASITDKTRALDKESQELVQTYDALQKANKGLIAQKTELQKRLQEVNEEVKAARKQFKELGDEASSDALNKATEKQQALRNEIAGTTKALQENQRIYKENIEIARKNALGGGEESTSLNDMAKGIVTGQIGQMFASSLGGLGQSWLTSAIGTPTASLISDALSNAISGGAAGAMFGLPGIAAGAVLGGVSGLISGGTKIFEAQDDAFKDYYGGLYNDVKGRSGEMVGAGTSLASTRETNRISFTTLFGGDEDRARSYLEDLIDTANSTPFLYDDLVPMSKTLATYGYNDSNILPLLQTIGDAGAALGMSTSDMNSVAQALGRMKSSDKATLEYLNMLNDRGIGAVGMLADAYGVSQGDMYSMISKGQISGTEAVEIITAALSRDKENGGYKGSMEEQSKTFAGISSTLEGLEQNLNALGGEGYNTLRQEGKEAEVNSLKGELGEAIGEINKIMGENQARRENLEDQYMRETLEAVLLGKEGSLFNEDERAKLAELNEKYTELKARYDAGDTDAGAELEALYETAQGLGKAYFENSAEVQRLNEIELEEIEAIRENTAGLHEATQASYKLSQELSKGLAATYDAPTYMAAGTAVWFPLGYGAEEYQHYSAEKYKHKGSFHAFGLDRVPYDEYPALLHEGERVLTASEARAQDAAQAGAAPIQSIVSGNTFVGVTEEMADQLWAIIVRNLEREARAQAPK